MQFKETPVTEQTNKTYSKIYQRTFETKYISCIKLFLALCETIQNRHCRAFNKL